MGKIIVAIRPSLSPAGTSGLTNYIAESKLKPEKEGLQEKEPRPLFSTNHYSLSAWDADAILGLATGTPPEKEDLIHVVISLEPEQHFEPLGESREEKVEAFKEIIREAASEIERELNVEELHWVAGIHLNTNNPHAHLAISREALDLSTGDRIRVKHIPRSLLPHNDKTPNGDKIFVPGKIAQRVNDGIQKHIEKDRHPQHEKTRELPSQDHHQELTSSPNAPDRTQTIPQGQTQESQPHQPDSPHDHSQPDRQDFPQGNNQPLTAHDLSSAPEILYGDPNDQTAEISEQDRSPNYIADLTRPPEPNEEHSEHSAVFNQNQPDTHTSFSDQPPQTQLHSDDRTLNSEELRKPQNVPEHLWKDRYILGRSMVARGEVDRLETDLKNTREHGDKRRFRVFDATHGHTRQISEFDIRRRADASATAAIRQSEIINPDQRHQARQTRYDTEIDRHDKGIGDHQIIVSKTIAKIETQLKEARAEHAELKPRVRQIHLHYQANQIPLPVPLLKPSEISKLQDQAIAARNPGRVRVLENVRESLAVERSDHSRSDEEIARLDGQLLTARSEHAARGERAHQFERTRHQTRWEIDGEKYSLADLDRQIAQQENLSHIFSSPLKVTTLNLRPSARREAAVQVKELNEIREIVVAKIDERRQELSTAVKEAGQMTSVLSAIHVKEQHRQLARGAERHEKLLTRSEINQLIEHGNALADPAMLKQAFLLETRFEERQLAEDKKPSLTTKTSRALGREVLTEIAVKQATERLEAFQERKLFTPVAIKNLAGEERTARLFDFRTSRQPILWLAQKITESKDHRHLRHETTKAIETEQTRLHEDLANAAKCHELTKDLSNPFREQLTNSGHPLPDATFTPKQIIQLEIYATRHQDPAERSRVQQIVSNAELAAHTQVNSTPTHQPGFQPPRQPEILPTVAIPGDHLRHADRLRNDAHNLPSPDIARNDSLHQPEFAHPSQTSSQTSSQTLSPQQHDQQQSITPEVSNTDLAKEAPDLDLLH